MALGKGARKALLLGSPHQNQHPKPQTHICSPDRACQILECAILGWSLAQNPRIFDSQFGTSAQLAIAKVFLSDFDRSFLRIVLSV
jgi:hypothetical protein